MPDNTYNGYTNYETWNVALYLDNEYHHYKRMQEVIRRPAYRHNAVALAKHIAVYVYWRAPFGDLKKSALRRVNWREIADGYIQELDLESHQVTESGTYRSIYLNDSDFDYQLTDFADRNTYTGE